MIINPDQVINTAKEFLDLGNTENDAVLEKFINLGAISLRTVDSYIVKCKNVELDDCGTGKLPDSTEEFLGASFPESSGCSCGCTPNVFGTTITAPGSIDTIYRPPCGCPLFYVAPWLAKREGWNGACSPFGNFFTINGNYISLPSTTNATSINVVVKAKNVDDDGLMILNDDQERGLACFAALNFAVKKWSSYTDGQRAFWERTWVAQVPHLRGKAQVKRFQLDKKSIWYIMNTIMSNRFLIAA